MSRRSIICRCRRQRQIIDLLATDKSRYFAQPRPIIVYYFTQACWMQHYYNHLGATILPHWFFITSYLTCTHGNTCTVNYIAAWKYSEDFPASSSTRRKAHSRSATEPMTLSQSYRPASPSRSLRYALDDLDISQNSWKNFSDPVLRYKSRYSPNLRAALGASDRIQQRVEKVIDKKSFRKFVSVKINLLMS